MPAEKKQAHLHWSSANRQQPCFCNETIYLNIEKLKATPETVGSIFGVRNPQNVTLQDKNGKELELDTATKCWPVQEDQQYEVVVVKKEGENGDDGSKAIPMNQIFDKVFGGDEDRLHKLSISFYNKIWHGEKTPGDFRAKFVSVSSSAKIQAYRQYNWFCEVFGGPSLLDDAVERDRILLPRTMAKHTASRMSKEYAETWLHLMNETVEEEFPEQHEKVKKILGLYWLHFYAFFPYNEDERAGFRTIALGE